MKDSPTILFDALPRNVVEFAKEAERGIKAGDPDYLPAFLSQVGVPRKARSSGRTFERTSGNVSLQIEAGRAWDGRTWQELALPYGVRPRSP